MPDRRKISIDEVVQAVKEGHVKSGQIVKHLKAHERDIDNALKRARAAQRLRFSMGVWQEVI